MRIRTFLALMALGGSLACVMAVEPEEQGATVWLDTLSQAYIRAQAEHPRPEFRNGEQLGAPGRAGIRMSSDRGQRGGELAGGGRSL